MPTKGMARVTSQGRESAIGEGWANVDGTGYAAGMVQGMDAIAANASFQALKRRSYEMLHVRSGQHLLDVGCGPGNEVQALAQLVGIDGRVVGIDKSAAMIAAASKRAEEWGLPVEFRVGVAEQLDFPDNTFDGCRVERTLQHLHDQRKVLLEMVRVTRPGGWIVAVEPDHETFIIDYPNMDVTRRIANFRTQSLGNPWIGRQLFGLFRECGLGEIAVDARTGIETWPPDRSPGGFRRLADDALAAGVLTAAEVDDWWGQLERANQEGRFFGSLTYFVVSGRKL